MKLNKSILAVLLCAGALWPQAQDSAGPADSAMAAGAFNDSGTVDIKKSGIDELDVWHQDSARRFNPFVAGAASLVLPGAGQVYTRHYVKAFFFPVLEGAVGGFVYFWKRTAEDRDADENRWLLLAASDTGAFSRAQHMEESYLARHGAVDARLSMYTYLAWAAGGYLYNVLDAVGSSNVIGDSKPRSATTAALLAAVPGLGLGQWYNGSLSKAGMVMMGQVSMGLMSYNSHRLMTRAEDNYQRLNAGKADTTVGKPLFTAYAGMWSSTRNRAFTNRNMYLWYSIFFYGYSIFDAVVDAYLHEYSEKMKVEPDLIIGNKQIYFTLQTTF
jgi:hypothetical protein